MANRIFHQIQAPNKEVKIIAGSFAPNGSSAVAATGVKGKGFTVARTSTGLFTITLLDKFYELLDFQHSLQLAAADDKITQGGAVSLSAKTVQVRVWDISGAAVADVAADAGNRINFCLAFRNTKIK